MLMLDLALIYIQNLSPLGSLYIRLQNVMIFANVTLILWA